MCCSCLLSRGALYRDETVQFEDELCPHVLPHIPRLSVAVGLPARSCADIVPLDLLALLS